MSNKFITTISASNSAIKTQRATALSKEVQLEAESLVNSLKRELFQLENEVMNMTDLAPSNTYSLRPGNEGFNAQEWVKNLHQAKLSIQLKELELKEAEAIYNEWFGESSQSGE
jgi:hypothetical protein